MTARSDSGATRDELLLPPDASSPRTARRFVAERVADALTDDVVDAALLVATELVTNALLHAPGEVRLRVRVAGDMVRIEVGDTNPAAPVPRTAARPDAATGRGLAIVARAASSWGVDAGDGGKTVWAEVGGRAAAAPDHPRAPVATGDVDVILLGVPTATCRAAFGQREALVRELTLIAFDPDNASPDVPARVVETVAAVLGVYNAQLELALRQLDAAERAGLETFDLRVTLPPGAGEAAQALEAVFDEADDYCRGGALLTLAAPEEVTRFRRWYLGEIVRQAGGAAPVTWAEWRSGRGGAPSG